MTERLLDTSVLIAWLEDALTPETEDEVLAGESSISMMTYVELCRYYHLAGKAREWNDVKAAIAAYHLVPLTKEVGERAAKEAVKSGLALADAIIYATAIENRLTLYTRDADFRKLKNVVVI